MSKNNTLCFRFFIILLFLSAQIVTDARGIDPTQLLEDLKTLASDEMSGRKSGTQGNALARAYIKKRFKELGIEPGEQRFTFKYKDEKEDQTGVNVLGTIQGSTSERLVVITAHYDHLGIKKGQIYNGADDNASGVAGLLAVVSHFTKNRPKHTLIVAALDAEENSGAGGGTLVASLDRNKISLNVNLDMIGRDRDRILYAVGTHHYPFLKPLLENIAAKSTVKLYMGHDVPGLKHVEDWTKESDHYAFHKQGIPFIYFGVEDFEHHHKPTDDFESMTHEFFVDAVQTILIAIEEFDQHL